MLTSKNRYYGRDVVLLWRLTAQRSAPAASGPWLEPARRANEAAVVHRASCSASPASPAALLYITGGFVVLVLRSVLVTLEEMNEFSACLIDGSEHSPARGHYRMYGRIRPPWWPLAGLLSVAASHPTGAQSFDWTNLQKETYMRKLVITGMAIAMLAVPAAAMGGGYGQPGPRIPARGSTRTPTGSAASISTPSICGVEQTAPMWTGRTCCSS